MPSSGPFAPAVLAVLGWLCGPLPPALAQQPVGSAPEVVLLRAPAARVFEDLTTADGIVRLFAVAQARVELRVGGSWATHHDAGGKLGDAATSVLEVAAFEPARLLALRLPPADVRDEKAQPAVLVLRLEAHGPDRTRLFVTRHGWQLPGPAGERLLLGPKNPRTLEAVQQHYAAGPDAAAPGAVQELLRELVGGTWMTTPSADGARRSFHVRVGSAVEIEEWRGPGHALLPSGRIDCCLDPSIDAWVFTRWQADGGFVRGHLRCPRRRALEFVGAAGDGREEVVRWVLHDGRLVGEVGDRFVFERKDAVPAKLR